ncbi:MAG TPA: tRNA (adenosine(37)-N6)-dimethylallyltransferase MiaA [Dehalococcoidia bacterium]|nr:tRNA (adenosine(37)-N6)-dimethylallyltransferase MiaA [Dehalococcoidia bacterium]
MTSSAAPPLVAVVGPTATGKSDLAVALARTLGGEVVGADSRQVYHGMAIGTAQPGPALLAAVPHHLIGFLDPATPFGLAQYLDLARAAIAGIRAPGRLPIVTGGTGQYVAALVQSWSVPRVPPDPALRATLSAEAERAGPQALHKRLAAIDQTAAATIHPHNVRRVIRALEVILHSGRLFSAQRLRSQTTQGALIGLELPRETLYERIDRRVEAMYDAGLLAEVRRLAAAGYRRDLPSMGSIGYPEAWAALAGEITPAEAIRRTQLATHRLARQQLTWFRRAALGINWLRADRPDLVQAALGLIEAAAGGTQDEGDDAVHQDARHR